MTRINSHIYLDNNATTPLRPEAKDIILDVLAECGNPSSIHAPGRHARARVSIARDQIAKLIEAEVDNIIFTSSCTEANMHVLTPNYRKEANELFFTKLLVGATEHPSVLSGGRFDTPTIEKLLVDKNGIIDCDNLKQILQKYQNDGMQILVSVMFANNETGVIQPIAKIGNIVREFDGYLHVDATQIVGRQTISLASLNCDMLTMSAHKLGGPLGVGAIVFADNDLRPSSLIKGGGQESHNRGGTENVLAISGFGAVAEYNLENQQEQMKIKELRDNLEQEMKSISPELVIFGESVERIGNTSCFTIPGIKAETAVIAFDLEGVAISSGSACSSGKVSESHVLKAMNVPVELVQGALRVSVGWANKQEDIERFLEKLRYLIERLRPDTVKHAA